jgi:hypothetical protein
LMADLLTHVLIAYILLTVASWRVEWPGRPWTAVGMCSTGIPDLTRLDLVVDDLLVGRLLGVPFDLPHSGRSAASC